MIEAWFGVGWGAPINRIVDPTRTPVGELCFRCQKAIKLGDMGYIINREAWHLVCFLGEQFGEDDPNVRAAAEYQKGIFGPADVLDALRKE